MNAIPSSIETIVWQAQVPLVEFSRNFSQEIKTQKVALVALSFLSATLACTAVAALLVGIFSLTTSLISVPLLTLSFLFSQASLRLKDYEDPLELQGMKESAKSMSFLELVREHQGIEPLLTHHIVDLLELRSKFLIQHEGKKLSDLMREVPLSYMRKSNLVTQQHLRSLFYEELSQKSDITDLYNALEGVGLNELKQFGVISVKEYELFEGLLAQEGQVESLQRANLLRLNSQFLGRRESILSDLDVKEKKAKEDLQRAYSQNKPTSFSTLRTLQGLLSSVQEEKIRVQKDPSIGQDSQREYDQQREESYKQYKSRKKELQEEFRSFHLGGAST